MATSQDPPDYIHRAAVDAEGNRIGKISQMSLDEQAGQPQWVLVETGVRHPAKLRADPRI